jgi:hypothetical protein
MSPRAGALDNGTSTPVVGANSAQYRNDGASGS